MANTNIINAVFGSGLCAVTTSAFRANYGMVLRFSGIELPTAFEVDFSNYDVMGRDSITMIGQNGEVQIPDDLWDSGLNIYAYVYLHPTDDSGVTVYTVTIPVLGRPNRTEETPTPHEQTVIEQAISALNDAVEQTAADVVAADASASAAAQSEANAATSERAAAASAGAALASQNAAESAAQSATESALASAESAQNAANSASQAAQSATDAQEYAEQAEQSAQSISGDVERAERAAATATEKATEAASSASTASGKANEAAQSAQSAASAAQNAAASEQSAQSHATDAETAKQDAQDAQTAAEQAAQSVSGLSAQIAQNTSDIAELVLSKAGALIDTASGSIASFVPDSTIPTVKGLTVNVEPVQDLHGYDNPWPAGGGKNLVDTDELIPATGAAYNKYGWKNVLKNNTTYTYSVYGETGYSFRLMAGHTKEAVPQPNIGLSTYYVASGRYQTFTTPSDIEDWEYLFLGGSASGSANANCQFQIELGENSNPTYHPYSNICPISGWDEVEVQRTGKNLLENELTTSTVNGTSFTVNADGSITVSGTPTAQTRVAIKRGLAWDGREAAIFSFGAMPTGTRVFARRIYNGTQNYPTISPTGTTTIGAEIYDIYLEINTSFGGTAFTVYPQLELGSTATAYEPYQGDTYTIQLGQTVYGGTLDVTNGVLTVDRAMVDLGTLPWAYNTTYAFFISSSLANRAIGITNLKSDLFKTTPCSWSGTPLQNAICGNGSNATIYVQISPYDNVADFVQLVAGHQLVYELATPITIDLTPIEVAVLTGQTNNIWADCGDVSVEYAADLKHYIDTKIAAAVAALS